MKKYETLSVGEIIRRAMEQTGSMDTYMQQQACFIWPDIVGPAINQATIRRWVNGSELHVCLSSAPLKNEVMFLSDQIIKMLNKNLGQNVITKIIIH